MSISINNNIVKKAYEILKKDYKNLQEEYEKQIIEENELINDLYENCGEKNNIICSTRKFIFTNSMNFQDKLNVIKLINNTFDFVSQIEKTNEIKSNVFKFLYNNEYEVIIKSILESNDISKNNLIHEAFIAIYGTNNLREQGNPNFSYIYGLFRCKNNGQSKNLCSDEGDNKIYLIYENIEGIIYNDFLKTCTLKEFIYIFAQIILSLQDAYNKLGFTHYDLYPDNIIISKNNKFNAINYNENYCLIENNNIVNFIDYERSHIEINGKHYGFQGLEEYQIFSDRNHPLYDVYKIFSAWYCVRYCYG